MKHKAMHSSLAPVVEQQRRWDPLYFHCGARDEREMLSANLHPPYVVRSVSGDSLRITAQNEYPVIATATLNGTSYAVRQVDQHLLFRDLASPATEDAWFLPNTSVSDFAEAFQRRRPGRCIMHSPGWMEKNRCVYLFFDLDGSGFALNPAVYPDTGSLLWTLAYERIDFRWDHFLRVTPNVLSAPVEKLHETCASLFEEEINPRLHEPYLHQETALAWQRGSKKELRRLATAICHSEPDLFEGEEAVTAVFRAATEGKRGGFLWVERGWNDDYDRPNRYTSRRLTVLGELAFRLNPFVGMKWINLDRYNDDHYCLRETLNPVSLQWSKSAELESSKMQKAAVRVEFRVEPPSAHEKAEAILEVVDWLDDKLHDSEKRARFGLPARVVSPV